mgnify:CR=1 FL=1
MDPYDLVVQEANNGLWDWDLASNRVHFSARWHSILGFEAGSCGTTPEEWFKRVHPADLEQVRHTLDSRLADGSLQFTMQHRMRHKDGAYRWMSCQGVITRDNNGKAVRVAGSHSDITAEKVVDPLTGLPNRLMILSRLTRAIETTSRYRSFLYAVLVLDLDRPASVVKRTQAQEGDLLLVAAARRLERFLQTRYMNAAPGRDYVAARDAGDQFLVLLEGLSTLDEAVAISTELLNDMSAPFQLEGSEVLFPASIGIALSATGYGKPEEALRDAETALYRANSLGKGRCEVFDTAIIAATRSRAELENDLRWALQRKELHLAYQPIVQLSTGRIAGFEALLRWNHPGRGSVPPSEFIPIAEATGLIIPLGSWVVREACSRLKKWKEVPQAPPDLWVSLNLSAVQFRHESLVKEIAEVIRTTGLEANRLVLELTEGSIMEKPEAASRSLMELRIMGAQVAVDDFGTGYSSLSRLCKFPLDYLKIDRNFVAGIESSRDAHEVIRTINELASQLGLRVIAEGIETRGQLELVRSLGCGFGQGFLFSQGVGSEQAEFLLMNGLPKQVAQEPEAVLVCPEPLPPPPRRSLRVNRKLVFAGAAAIVLICTGTFLAKFSSVPPPPPSHDFIPQVRASALESPPATGPAKEAPPPVVEVEPTATPKLSTAAVIPAPPKPAAPALPPPVKEEARKEQPQPQPAPQAHRYPVVHDHVIGNCKGTLEVSHDAISYVSEHEKCNFSLKYPECSYRLKDGRLTITSKSKNYRFKAADAKDKQENYSRLEAILQSIFMFNKN